MVVINFLNDPASNLEGEGAGRDLLGTVFPMQTEMPYQQLLLPITSQAPRHSVATDKLADSVEQVNSPFLRAVQHLPSHRTPTPCINFDHALTELLADASLSNEVGWVSDPTAFTCHNSP